MAPKNKFSRQEMIAAAVDVVREKGIDALTAKALAAKLGVSTQPVFTCFHTIEEAKREVRKVAESMYDSYIRKGLQLPIPFLGLGMQYISFARNERELYRLMFLSQREGEDSGAIAAMKHSQELARESLIQTYHIDVDTADRYFRDMWLVVHSLATLVVTDDCPYSEQEIGEILTGFSVSLCKAIKEIPGFAENHYDRDAIFTELISRSYEKGEGI